MFLDDSGAVIFGRSGTDHAGLDTSFHLKLIDVKVFFRIDQQGNLFAQTVKSRFSLGINAVIVKVDTRLHIDFRTGNVEERIGIAFRQGGGFCGIHDIIGNSRDFVRFFRNGKKSVKRKKLCHNCTLHLLFYGKSISDSSPVLKGFSDVKNLP